jgi:hypothetical protein
MEFKYSDAAKFTEKEQFTIWKKKEQIEWRFKRPRYLVDIKVGSLWSSNGQGVMAVDSSRFNEVLYTTCYLP